MKLELIMGILKGVCLTFLFYSLPFLSFAQKGWYFTLSGGPSWYETFSYKGIPIHHFFIYSVPGYTKGLHFEYALNDCYTVYSGLNWSTVRVGIGYHPTYVIRTSTYYHYVKGHTNIQTTPWQFDLGLRHHVHLNRRLFTRLTFGLAYIGMYDAWVPSISKSVNEPRQAQQWFRFRFEGEQLTRSNFMLKFGFGLEYRFKNHSRLGLEVMHGKAFRDIYQFNSTYFIFNGVSYDSFDITTKGSYTSLDLSYSFYLSRRKKKKT